MKSFQLSAVQQNGSSHRQIKKFWLQNQSYLALWTSSILAEYQTTCQPIRILLMTFQQQTSFYDQTSHWKYSIILEHKFKWLLSEYFTFTKVIYLQWTQQQGKH